MTPSISLEATSDGVLVELFLKGVADIAASEHLRELLLTALSPQQDVVVHVDGLEALDGAGLQVLLAAKVYVETKGKTLTVACAQARHPAMRAIELAGARLLLGSPGQVRANGQG